ncbi:O-antigen ligase family protein [Alkalicoccobacillus murimartini]|uniref:O-antigen ligase n=1 Tax=Alkalicoccobacillus murimartini TaxID=171685 RepID=A0ABT9YGB8_9BACI|nr:hypothetical protein [Alkalicoccobacillus murimartini]MDQ0206913.1 O-antigen ligase [Alkalicoccobacillus murimartini]
MNTLALDRRHTVIPSLLFIIMIALTVSSDLFLVFNVGGFALRFPQLITIILAAWWICSTLQVGVIKIPLGGLYLILWSLVILATIPNTTFLTRSLGYAFWLILNILLIFAVVYFVNTENKARTLYRWYLYSFVAVSLFGIIQFMLPIVGLPAPYITQWWTDGIPRVNGFSYEPSYYATYLITGWVMVFYLMFDARSRVFSKRTIFVFLSIMTLALLLSSSRMGILVMGVWFGRYGLLFIKGIITNKVHVKHFLIVAVASFLGIGLVGGLVLSGDTTLLAGTGLGGTPAHSVDIRSTDLEDTINVIKQNPIYGVSLGGVAPAIGATYGLNITDQEMAKEYEGLAVFVEVLAASGVIGFIPFALYIFTIIYRPFRRAAFIQNLAQKDMLRSMTYALMCLLLILQLNQNILRPYLWFHIACLCAIYAVAKGGGGAGDATKKTA